MMKDDTVNVHYGFPNPADEIVHKQELSLDLNHLIIKKPISTYMFRVRGHSWTSFNLYDNDIVIVDRSLIGQPNDILVIWEGDSFKFLKKFNLSHEDGQNVWGVVTHSIHNLRQS